MTYITKYGSGPVSFGGALIRSAGPYCYGCGKPLAGSEGTREVCPECEAVGVENKK